MQQSALGRADRRKRRLVRFQADRFPWFLQVNAAFGMKAVALQRGHPVRRDMSSSSPGATAYGRTKRHRGHEKTQRFKKNHLGLGVAAKSREIANQLAQARRKSAAYSSPRIKVPVEPVSVGLPRFADIVEAPDFLPFEKLQLLIDNLIVGCAWRDAFQLVARAQLYCCRFTPVIAAR